MGDFEELLKRVPPAQQAGMREWWSKVPPANRAFALKDMARQLDSRYPQPRAMAMDSAPVAPSDATAVARPNFPMMAPPSEIGAQGDPQAPFTPLSRLPAPGSAGAFVYGGASAVPFLDEAAAVGAATPPFPVERSIQQLNPMLAAPFALARVGKGMLTGAWNTPEYETARRGIEYQMGRAARDNPSEMLAGQTVSTVGQILAFPGMSAEQLAEQGAGRAFVREPLMGGFIGGLYGAGASDPGMANRVGSGAVGFGMGAAGGLLGAAAGEIAGSMRGTPQGRRFRNIAESGDHPLSEARRIVDDAPLGAPIAGADALGAPGASRLRAVATNANAGTKPTRSFFSWRQANRPTRVEEGFAEAAGQTGVENPYTRARLLNKARQDEARTAYDAVLKPKGRAYIIPPDRSTPLLRIREIRDIIDDFRAARAASLPDGPARDAAMKAVQTRAPGMNRITAEELHHVKRVLRERGEAAAPGGEALAQTEGFAANTNLEAVEAVLDRVPGYRRVNDRYAELSRGLEADAVGARALQTDPKLLEDRLLQMSPGDRQRAFEMLPSSVSSAVEQGSARGVMGRLGLGETPKVGKSRIIDLFTRNRPGFERRLLDMVDLEEGMAQTESAALTAMQNSHTEANKMANLAAATAEQGMIGTARRAVIRSLRDGPSAGELAKDAEILRATGSELRRILGEAEAANLGRGSSRRGFNLTGRAAAALAPTVRRTIEVADRATRQDEYWRLRAEGLSEKEAMEKAGGQ